MIDFIKNVSEKAGVLPADSVEAETGVSISVREGDGEKYFFVINCTDENKMVKLSKACYNLLEEKTESESFTLPPLGVKVLLETEVIGIPLSVSGKSPYFDRK